MKDKDFFGENTEQWKWKNFTSTISFPVSKNLIDWIIGQEKAKREIQLSIDEWINKLVWLNEKKWWESFEIVEKPRRECSLKIFGRKIHLFYMGRKEHGFNQKPTLKKTLPPGPFILLLGDPGTGKSLLGRAMQSYMTDIYNKRGIKLYDVCTWCNNKLPSQPQISIHPSPQGTQIIKKVYKQEQKKGRLLKWGIKTIMGLMIGFGLFILGYLGIDGLTTWFSNSQILVSYGGVATISTIQEYWGNVFNFIFNGVILPNIYLIVAATSVLGMGIMLYFFSRIFGGGMFGGKQKGIGGAENTKAPKLLIDNSSGNTPFVDATGHGSAQLFGSIAWDPYQTGGLGTPEHQRVTAGDVHRAHLGILYIDEIKNLTGGEAITLLTVLEDGQLPVALRSQFHGGDTAAMAVSTEPVPCTVFFIAAGNMDSAPQVHPALMDRITGYGKVVYMNTDIPNTVGNRRKFVQFISQESTRFNLLPFSRDACIEIIEEARRKSGRKDKLTCMFRQMISILKTANILAVNEGSKAVEKKHVKSAVSSHCKTIAVQVMEREQEQHNAYRIINPSSKPKIGQIYGLAVVEINNEFSGSVMPLRASMIKNAGTPEEGYCHVTGVQTEESSWVQHSISKIKHVVLQLCNVDPSVNYKTHIDFAQNIGVDGPSAGVAMTLLLLSILKNKPIRQDTCATGEINIGIEGQVIVTPIGGVHAKIMAAQNAGFKKVCIPKLNYKVNINPNDYTIKVKPCNTIEDYMREMLIDV